MSNKLHPDYLTFTFFWQSVTALTIVPNNVFLRFILFFDLFRKNSQNKKSCHDLEADLQPDGNDPEVLHDVNNERNDLAMAVTHQNGTTQLICIQSESAAETASQTTSLKRKFEKFSANSVKSVMFICQGIETPESFEGSGLLGLLRRTTKNIA